MLASLKISYFQPLQNGKLFPQCYTPLGFIHYHFTAKSAVLVLNSSLVLLSNLQKFGYRSYWLDIEWCVIATL